MLASWPNYFTKRIFNSIFRMKQMHKKFHNNVLSLLSHHMQAIKEDYLLVQGIKSFLIQVIASCNTHFSKTRYIEFLLYCLKEFSSFNRQISQITGIQPNSRCFVPASQISNICNSKIAALISYSSGYEFYNKLIIITRIKCIYILYQTINHRNQNG